MLFLHQGSFKIATKMQRCLPDVHKLSLTVFLFFCRKDILHLFKIRPHALTNLHRSVRCGLKRGILNVVISASSELCLYECLSFTLPGLFQKHVLNILYMNTPSAVSCELNECPFNWPSSVPSNSTGQRQCESEHRGSPHVTMSCFPEHITLQKITPSNQVWKLGVFMFSVQ